eukprot:gene33724-45165_t
MAAVVFISAVTEEFRAHRDMLAREVRLPGLQNHTQEFFVATGTETLDKLDEYIRDSEAVLLVVGQRTGGFPHHRQVEWLARTYSNFAERFANCPDIATALATGQPAFSYTQWEAYLAHYHGKLIIIYRSASATGVSPADPVQVASQTAHLERLKRLGHHVEKEFFAARRRGSLCAAAHPTCRGSIGTLFMGRDAAMAKLKGLFASAGDGTAAAVTSEAIHGLGGIGKTRLAIEYARAHAMDYSALLFVSAETPATLTTNMSAL